MPRSLMTMKLFKGLCLTRASMRLKIALAYTSLTMRSEWTWNSVVAVQLFVVYRIQIRSFSEFLLDTSVIGVHSDSCAQNLNITRK